MRTRVFLSPTQPQLIGKYSNKAEHVHVVCNASQAFSFALPDLSTCENTEFPVYNLPTSAGNVTVTAKLMSTGETSHVLAPGDTVTFVSDLKSMWVLSDINNALSGTTNYLAKFTGAKTVGNSLIRDDGTLVTSGGPLSLENCYDAFNTSVTNPLVYSTAHDAGSVAYPFLENGNLVIQSRASAGRDIVFVAGNPPAIIMIVLRGGEIKIPALAGTGSRTVVASADGTLSAP